VKVTISNPDKVLFPEDGITKADLADYYEAVGPVMIPHVKNRPLMLQRYPNGIEKEGWIQQEIGKHFPDWIARVTAPKSKGHVTHPMANDGSSLLYLANQASITIHEWLSRADKLFYPDLFIVDLDPSPENTFADVKKIARAVRALLEEIGLPAFVKTSGSKGLHIAVPLKRTDTFETVGEFGGVFAEILNAREPALTTLEFYKAKRGARIFIDVHRNQYAQHVVAPYAVRAIAGAPVSCPIEWDELASPKLDARTFTLRSTPKKVERDGDPWNDIKKSAVALRRARNAIEKLR
jgi:bifunctional non-homologous end joining protein LigD